MAWLEFKLRVESEHLEALEACLFELGAEAVTYRADDMADGHEGAGHKEAILEPAPGQTPLWEKMVLTALFDEGVDADQLRLALDSGGFGPTACSIRQLADRVWERVWMDHYAPMRFGRHLWIVPSFARPPDDEGAICLSLDPGLAFGSGTHATTALCLEYLDRFRPIGKRVLDYGYGSGILALAALKLGASRVWAVDHDPQALIATRENLLRNAIDEERLITCDPDHLVAEPVDLLTANILSSTLIELAPRLRKLVKRGGQIVLSGILAEQTESVSSAYGLSSVDKNTRDGWVSLRSVL